MFCIFIFDLLSLIVLYLAKNFRKFTYNCLHLLQGGYSPGGGGGAQSDYYGSIGYGTTYGAVTFGQMSWRGSQAQL